VDPTARGYGRSVRGGADASSSISQEDIVSRYLFQASYTSDSWATQVANPASVVDRIQPVLTACKASLDSIYYAFGDSDIVALIDFPTAEDAAAFSLAVSAGGSIKSAQTTPLLTVEQGMAAMKKAAEAGKKYQPATTINLEARPKAKTR
jgi:uncharacterized protein with GYD domain